MTAGLGLAAFLPYLAFSIQGLCVALLIWQVWLIFKEAPAPGKSTLFAVVALSAILVLQAHHTLLGKQAGLTLLTLLLPLKLLETKTRRDARAVLLLCCFMLTGQFLNAQSLPVAGFVILCAAAIIATSAKLELPQLSLREASHITLGLLGSALPLMLLLFVLFPRVDGPLWGMPLDAYGGVTGLSDRMRPGSIANLIQSGEIAFRVEFAGTPPPPALRYWRGPVLTDFDGREWRQRSVPFHSLPTYHVQGPAYHYVMTLEAHNRNWLLAMDYPGAASIDVSYGNDLALLSRQPVRSRLRYTLTSYPASPVGLDEHTYVLRAALKLPTGSNPRTVSLGEKIAADHATPLEKVNAAIDFMRRGHLIYTLNPPLTGQNGADDFLFETKRGFCEHFANAFAILMRAAGVPTRVVTGYQGGELNPLDGTLVVRQSDAHAWTEVWLPGRGWVRIDPTAASAPLRIDEGIANALPQADRLPMMLRADSPLLRRLRFRWEALGNAWNQWVLGYNSRRQFELLQKLGFPDADWHTLISLLGSCILVWAAWLSWRLWPHAIRRDALDRCWQQACHKLARHGIRRQPWEGPTAFAQRAGSAIPAESATAFKEIAEHYAILRYAPAPINRKPELAALKQAVQQFNP